MTHDPLTGETILWSGFPRNPRAPRVYKLVAGAALVFSVATLALAMVAAVALHRPVGPTVAFSALCALVAVATWTLPLVWLSRVAYFVTDRHVVWTRGRLRRAIPRAEISYAVIRWVDEAGGVGDLILERAVPTGALRRTLTVELVGVERPDRVLGFIRDAGPLAPRAEHEVGRSLPLPQRLEPGERVLWSAIPAASPASRRRALSLLLALFILAAVARMLSGFVPAMARIARAHALSGILSGLLVGAVALVALLLAALAGSVIYTSWIRPRLLARRTRYFVTDRRVLIRRGAEELHLDRARIAYVILAPVGPRASVADVFLVLNGPQARGLSLNGAFGDAGDPRDSLTRDDRLRPVFAATGDAETATEILGEPLRHAA